MALARNFGSEEFVSLTECRPRLWRKLSSQMSAAVQEYAQKNHNSLECLVAASWSHLLSCYVAQDWIQIERFVPALDPLRDPILVSSFLPAGSQGLVREWLQEVFDTLNGDVPISSTPSQTSVVGENIPEVAALVRSVIVVGNQAAIEKALHQTKNRLIVEVLDGSEIVISISHDDALLDSEFSNFLLDCLKHIVEQLPVLDGRLVSEIELVPLELQARVDEICHRGPRFHSSLLVHEMIEEQSQRTPDRTAAICDNERITYQTLNESANQFARYLAGLGVGPEAIVAIHLPRSIHLLIGVLGILKAGAAFLPLDVSLPTSRLQTILESSQASVVITEKELAGRFQGSKISVVSIDSETKPWKQESAETFRSPARMENLAYVIYTSGSTGQPKGVMIEHRNLVASFAGMEGVLGSVAGVWLATANISFDISIIELLWTLVYGFEIVLHQGDGGAPVFFGPGSIAEQMIEYGVTHFQGTPSFMRMVWSDPAAEKAFGRLRRLLVGGEPFPSNLADLLVRVVPGDVFNVYGPTEATICSTFHLVRTVRKAIPIGQPMSNMLVYVLDRWGRILPPLAAGELFLGGDGIGRGYLGRPDLTAERFINKRFPVGKTKRLYQTGDLVRRDMDGALLFLDRLDSQVKIRGYRIELGEIESTMHAHPHVQQAAVLVRKRQFGEASLVGYYTTAERQNVTAADLRAYLEKTLPSYMVPQVLLYQDFLPVTPNGKIDRSKLAQIEAPKSAPEPSKSASECEDPHVRAIESTLCAWCRELLDLPQVSPLDDFFDIGGQSIAAAQLAQRIAKQYRVRLKLGSILKARTMRAIAHSVNLAAAGSVATWSPVVSIRSRGSKPPIFLIAGVGGNIVNFELLAGFLGEDRPVYGVETEGLNRRSEVLRTIEDMARTYLEEIRVVQKDGPYHIAGYSFGGIIAFEMAQQLRAGGSLVGLVGLIDTPEWSYIQKVEKALTLVDRLKINYGGTFKRALLGPDRMQALVARLKALGAWFRSSGIMLHHVLQGRSPVGVATAESRNLNALRRYAPKRYEYDLHLFPCPDRDPLRGDDLLLGWGGFAERIIVSEIPGLHGDLIKPQFVGFLGDALRNSLEAVEKDLSKEV
jgi:amino acid adenylation domain-containing protein